MTRTLTITTIVDRTSVDRFRDTITRATRTIQRKRLTMTSKKLDRAAEIAQRLKEHGHDQHTDRPLRHDQHHPDTVEIRPAPVDTEHAAPQAPRVPPRPSGGER